MDYLNIMDSSKKLRGASKESSTQAEIAWEIKKFAAGFNESEGLPIWTAAQIKDEAYGKIIQSKHIKYSRGILEHCPLAFGISDTEDDEFTDTITCSSVKTRDGKRIKPFKLISDFDYMTIGDFKEEKKL
jgi:hypothetical protein